MRFRLSFSLLLASLLHAQAPPQATETALIQRIDHIVVAAPDQRGVDQLQDLFRLTLGLPLWFSAGTRRSADDPEFAFYNTGVYLGNVFFEFITFQVDEPKGTPPAWKPHFYAFALESNHPDTAAELRRRGLPGAEPSSFLGVDAKGNRVPLFTNIALDLGAPGVLVFFCAYPPEGLATLCALFPGFPNSIPIAQSHEHFQRLMRQGGGGSLGVLAVEELVLAAPKTLRLAETCDRLFAPTRATADGLWYLPKGPALRLVEGEKLRVARLVLKVNSLERARRFLAEQGLLPQVSTGAVQTWKLSPRIEFALKE